MPAPQWLPSVIPSVRAFPPLFICLTIRSFFLIGIEDGKGNEGKCHSDRREEGYIRFVGFFEGRVK